MNLKLHFISEAVFSTVLFEKRRNKTHLGTVTESVYASGIIKTNDQYTVYSTVNGFCKKNVLLQGAVGQGQLLLNLKAKSRIKH
jgi:hypothetical protein